MYNVTVKITLRESILDPQGNATQNALQTLGFDSVERVRIGKFVELHIDEEDEETARRTATDACEKLLANPVMDDFAIIEISRAS